MHLNYINEILLWRGYGLPYGFIKEGSALKIYFIPLFGVNRARVIMFMLKLFFWVINNTFIYHCIVMYY